MAKPKRKTREDVVVPAPDVRANLQARAMLAQRGVNAIDSIEVLRRLLEAPLGSVTLSANLPGIVTDINSRKALEYIEDSLQRNLSNIIRSAIKQAETDLQSVLDSDA